MQALNLVFIELQVALFIVVDVTIITTGCVFVLDVFRIEKWASDRADDDYGSNGSLDGLSNKIILIKLLSGYMAVVELAAGKVPNCLGVCEL